MRPLPSDPERLRCLADGIREARCGPRVSYVNNLNISVTDRCAVSCAFCGFSRKPDDPAAYALDVPEVLALVSEHARKGVSEVCLQSGISADFGLDEAVRLLRGVKRSFPGVHVHAFSPMEVFHFSGRDPGKAKGVLSRLLDEGLGSMPGTAAEILAEDVRRAICPGKLDSSAWERIVKAAHRVGIPTTATILIGHVETEAHRMRHLEIIRAIQEETGGFTEFIVLPFVPWNTRLRERCPEMISRREVLRFTAAARVVLDGAIGNIQASWVKMGLEGAVEALRWGANDLGGTLYREEISRSAGGTGPPGLPEEALRDAIARAGRVPVRRDTLYNELEVQVC